MSNHSAPGGQRHYIPEWAEHRRIKQSDIVRELGVDKALVSRWFNKGVIPTDKWIGPLAELMQTEVAGLFRHPDDDWIAAFFRDKTEEQKERAVSMLQLFFSEINGTGQDENEKPQQKSDSSRR